MRISKVFLIKLKKISAGLNSSGRKLNVIGGESNIFVDNKIIVRGNQIGPVAI